MRKDLPMRREGFYSTRNAKRIFHTIFKNSIVRSSIIFIYNRNHFNFVQPRKLEQPVGFLRAYIFLPTFQQRALFIITRQLSARANIKPIETDWKTKISLKQTFTVRVSHLIYPDPWLKFHALFSLFTLATFPQTWRSLNSRRFIKQINEVIYR